MTFLAPLALVFPLLAGWVIVGLLFDARSAASRLVLTTLVIGVGFAVFSGLTLVLLLIFGPSQNALVAIEAILGAAIVLYKIRLYKIRIDRRRHLGETRGAAPAQEAGPVEEAAAPTGEPPAVRILSLCFYLVLAASSVTFLVLLIRAPHGGWDAWAIWNLKARYIFRGGANWKNAFSSVLSFSHPDYPLLIPLSVAGSWILLGTDTPIVPGAISFIFTFATVILLSSSLTILRSRGQGYAAGLALLGSSLFIVEGSHQYADAPAAFFYLAAAVLLALYDAASRPDKRLLVLAGVVAGFAAWTKNEGTLFLVAITASRLLIGFRGKPLTAHLKETIPVLMGAAPAVVLLLIFKTQVAGAANDILSERLVAGAPTDVLSTLSPLQKLLSPARYSQTANAFLLEMWRFGGWTVSVMILLAAYLGALGVSVAGSNRRTINTLVCILSIMMAGLFFVFILTPYDLSWHLTSALPRLLLQLWPSFLLTFFLVARTPEKALAARTPQQRRQEYAGGITVSTNEGAK